MTNADIHAELLKLRKQVEALSEARRQHTGKEHRDADNFEEKPEPSENDINIRKQIEELIDSVQEEIRDMPALPTLGVFLLGILVGRYLR